MRTHTGEQTFKFDKCSKRFRLTQDLKVHMSTYADIKPFQCDECSIRFSTSMFFRVTREYILMKNLFDVIYDLKGIM